MTRDERSNNGRRIDKLRRAWGNVGGIGRNHGRNLGCIRRRIVRIAAHAGISPRPRQCAQGSINNARQ